MKHLQPVWVWLRLSLLKGFNSGKAVFFISLVPVTMLAALVVPVVAGATSVQAESEGQGVITQIRVTCAEDGSGKSLTAADLNAVAAIGDVTAVVPQDPATLYSRDNGTSAAWGATALRADPASLPKDIPRELVEGLSGNQVIVPSSIDGEDLAQWVGREMPASYSEMVDAHTAEARDTTVKVMGSYPSTWSAPYPDTIFVSQDLLVRLLAAQNMVSPQDFLDRIGFAEVLVNVSSSDAVDTVSDEIRRRGFQAYPLRDRLGRLPDTLAMMPPLIALVALATLIATTGLIVLSVRSSLNRRVQEFGLLRLRGWKRSDVFRLVLIDVGLGVVGGTTLGSVIGLGVGTILTQLLLHASIPLQPAVATLGSIWLVVVGLSSLTALAATWVGTRRDPFIAIMTPG